MVVTLAVDRMTVPPGAELAIEVSVRNVGPDSLLWRGGGCELLGDLSITPRVPAPAPVFGRAWDGEKGILKTVALSGAIDLGGPTSPAAAINGQPLTCTADLAVNELASGAESLVSAVWTAGTIGGSPAPAGSYRVQIAFPLIARGRPAMPADYDADVVPIVAALDVEVESHPDPPSPVQAIDEILGHARLDEWLRAHPRTIWNSASMRYRNGGWQLEISYGADQVFIARPDPTTGQIGFSE